MGNTDFETALKLFWGTIRTDNGNFTLAEDVYSTVEAATGKE